MIKKIVKIFFAIVLVGVLIFFVNWHDVWHSIVSANPYFVGLFVFLYICGIVISARKWELLGRFAHFTQSYFFYLKTYLIGTFLNNFFPSFIGGDAYRSLVLSSNKKNIGKGSATVVIDRVSGLIAVIFLACVCGSTQYIILRNNVVIIGILLSLGVVFIMCIGGIVFFRTTIVQKIITWLPQFVQKYSNILSQFHNRSLAITSFLYAIFFSFVGIALANYMLFLAVGADISFGQYISVIFLTNVIASMPMSIGNIGTKEWAYIFLFGVFGVNSGVLVAIVLLSRALQMLISLVALPLYVNEKKTANI